MIVGTKLPNLALQATNGTMVDLSEVNGKGIIYAYPRTSPPDSSPIKGWDLIPGARGCTPQSCAFRDYHSELKDAGADFIFGLSSQSTMYQKEVVARLHLPFPILSDEGLAFAENLGLPTFKAEGMVLFQRLTLIVSNGAISHVMYPITEPENNAAQVLEHLRSSTPNAP